MRSLIAVVALTFHMLAFGATENTGLQSITTMQASPTAFDGRLFLYSFGVDTGDRDAIIVARVSLTDAARLRITLLQYPPGDLFGMETPTRTQLSLKLSQPVYSLLRQRVEVLANADIHVATAEVVCQMMPSIDLRMNSLQVARQYDRGERVFLQGLALVHTGPGCWRTRHAYPTDTQALDAALALRAQIEVLATHVFATAQ
jgi:hypothetical protein